MFNELADDLNKIGSVYFGTESNIRGQLDTWQSDGTYKGSFDKSDSVMTMVGTGSFFAGTAAMQIRNLQRHDITSYAEGKAIIDDLMA